MTMFHKHAAPRAVARRDGPASQEAAPALFRLLADSALYRAAMAASRVPLAVLDAGRSGLPYVFVNPAFERLSGYAARDTLGRPASLNLALRGRDASLEALLGLTSAETATPPGLWIACQVRRRDGTERAVRVAFDPVRDNQGRISHWIVALDDASIAL